MSAKKLESRNTTGPLHYERIKLVRQLMSAGAVVLALLLLAAEMRAQCALDSFDPKPNGLVHAIVVQPDGKILIGGDFNTISANGGAPVARFRLARLNPDGTLDTAFDCSANCNVGGEVYAIAVQADGKVLIGGDFTRVGGQNLTRRHIARLDATTGTVDSFDPDADGTISALAVQRDGKILAGGNFLNIGGQARPYLARLDATTGLVDSFDANPSSNITALALQPDDKILVGGYFTTIGGQSRSRIARLDPVTGLADSFDPRVSFSGDSVRSIVVQGDGKILAGGDFTDIGGQTRRRIGRLDGTTGLADSFNPNALHGTGYVQSIAVQTDGKVLAAGYFTNIGGQPRNFIARLDATTGLADSFDPHSNLPVRSIALQPDGKILAGGTFTSTSGQVRNNIAQLDPNCSISTPSTLVNISTRLRVLSGDNALIGGMIVTGNVSKYVIVRALGPVLSDFGVSGVLADPTLELYRGNQLYSSNDNWRESLQQAAIEASGLAPTRDAESAIFASLDPGQNYTAIVRGKNGATGIGVMEVFDVQSGTSSLANISTRGFVDVDDNVMIAGLIAGPATGPNMRILVRVLGPTLGDFGVAGSLADPTLDLVNSSGTLIRSNDNWKDDQQQRAAIEAAGLAPSHDEEAALVETVAPGAYTAVVRGSNRATGVGLVEAYNIP